jgi:signal transduction histidine kinase
VLLEVEDQGPGVAASDVPHIFEPFHRSDPSRARSTGGVGLGLAIVDAIVRSHRGALGVHPAREGEGACFWVRLPDPVYARVQSTTGAETNPTSTEA